MRKRGGRKSAGAVGRTGSKNHIKHARAPFFVLNPPASFPPSPPFLSQELGWTYITAFEESQRYKEGKTILEKAAISVEDGAGGGLSS